MDDNAVNQDVERVRLEKQRVSIEMRQKEPETRSSKRLRGNAKSSRPGRSDVMVFSRERFDPSEKAVAEAAFTKTEADQVVRSRI